MNQIDFNKEFHQPIKEKEECSVKKEQWERYISENGLKGFFNQKKKNHPPGIIFQYDVEEMKQGKS